MPRHHVHHVRHVHILTSVLISYLRLSLSSISPLRFVSAPSFCLDLSTSSHLRVFCRVHWRDVSAGATFCMMQNELGLSDTMSDNPPADFRKISGLYWCLKTPPMPVVFSKISTPWQAVSLEYPARSASSTQFFGSKPFHDSRTGWGDPATLLQWRTHPCESQRRDERSHRSAKENMWGRVALQDRRRDGEVKSRRGMTSAASSSSCRFVLDLSFPPLTLILDYPRWFQPIPKQLDDI